MIYNTIQHEIRNKANLSLIDWCLLESIHHLCNSGKSKYKGWCNAKKAEFTYLASERTIVNRFNHLESQGWIEFGDSSRYLKRTTQKYISEVYDYIKGVKKLHGEKVAPFQGVKELHPKGEKVAPQKVKKLHGKGEKVACPNNNKSNKINNKKDNESKKEKDTHTLSLEKELKELKKENQQLKTQAKKEKKKSCAKKEKHVKHVFPDLTSEKKYSPKSPKETTEVKNYQIALNDFTPPANWTDELIEVFLLYCEYKDEKSKGHFGQTNVKAIIRKINQFLGQHKAEDIAAAMELGMQNPKWSDFDPQWVIDRRTNKSQTSTTSTDDLFLSGDLKHRNTWSKKQQQS